MNDTIEKFDDRTEYKRDGKLHRDNDLPAVEYATGSKYWYLNGQLHRTDGPAMEYYTGDRYWYLNGKRHRTDGPAVEFPFGDKHWYLNGLRHRIDGPAVEFADGSKCWFLNGNELTEEEITIQLAVIRYEQAMVVV